MDRYLMRTTAAGPDGNWEAGHEYSAAELGDMASAFVDAGYAERLHPGAPVESEPESEPDPAVERAVEALSGPREQAVAEESKAERAVEDDRRSPKKRRGRKSKPKKASGG